MGISELLKGGGAARATEDPVSDTLAQSTGQPDADILDQDPKPAHRQSRPPRVERPKGKLPTTQAGKRKMEQQVRDNLTMFLGMGSVLGMRVDPHCFGVLAQQTSAIIDALVPIIMRNANLLRWFAGSDARYLEYLALAQALAPVATTVVRHHVLKPRDADGGAAPVGQPYDLSAFVA